MSLTDYVGGTQAGQAVQSGSSTVYNNIAGVQNYINGVTGKPPGSSNYVLIPPKGAQGIAGFVFDYEGDDELAMESDITDHFAEDNSSTQDHIALKPYKITLRGFVSELVLPGTGQGLFGALTTLQQRIGTVPAYLGKYTPQALQKLQGSASKVVSQAQNYANTAAQYLNQAKNIAALFGGNSGATTKQQQTFATLVNLRDQRQIFSVVTPWAFFGGMAVESLVFIQPRESRSRSDISVTMKQMRFVDIESSDNVAATHAGPAAANYQPQSFNGATQGTPVTGSLTSTIAPLGIAGPSA